ncbi:MAG: Gfo/Idh/MocA family oxidoreductase [Alphaproteobacteria bacterium]|nr:Gfo/Idh/MocA family oxidoreductase [Alphaproteobacteria bacterium]
MTKKVRIAVIGFGLVGKRHARVIASDPSLALAAVVEPDTSKVEEIEEMGARQFISLEELLNGSHTDGVVLATPTPLHVEQAEQCLSAHVPVLIEKPISTTAAEAQRVVDISAAIDVPVLVGHHRRYNGMVRAAKQAIDDGRIGEVRAASAICWLYKPDLYFHEAPWRTKKGAGPISVNLVHDVDLLRHFCGEVTRVQALARRSARGHENEDVAAAILNFRSGALANVSVSDAIAAPWSWELTANENPTYHGTEQSCYQIGGSRGSLSIPDLRIWQHKGEPDWWSPIHAETLVADPSDPLVIQARHFADVIMGNAQPVVSGREGMRSLQVIEAIQTAASTGLPVELDTVESDGGVEV